jgi:hypothetical protein
MRFLWIAVVVSCTACAGNLRPATSTRPNDEALLILPGFGYGRAGARALESLAPTINREGIDLYVADYLTRGGLASSRTKLERFIHDYRLDRYRRVHVFAFIAGAWTVNPLIEAGKLPNLGRIVYDRSPFQERAPAIAVDQLRLLAWLRYGSTIFDLSRTSYPPIAAPGVDVALVVESVPTTFITRHEKAVRALGQFAFECGAFNQQYDDCGYVELSHDELYKRFAELWPELLSFIRTGHFSAAMDRMPPAGDLLDSIRHRPNP